VVFSINMTASYCSDKTTITGRAHTADGSDQSRRVVHVMSARAIAMALHAAVAPAHTPLGWPGYAPSAGVCVEGGTVLVMTTPPLVIVTWPGTSSGRFTGAPERKSGTYVLAARSAWSGLAVGTDVLKMYGGAVGVGVGTSVFGSAVGTVSVSEEKSAESDACGSAVAFAGCSGYKPIIGGSLPAMP
jgi:hypothetical protein